jgi:hypothetical protein
VREAAVVVDLSSRSEAKRASGVLSSLAGLSSWGVLWSVGSVTGAVLSPPVRDGNRTPPGGSMSIANAPPPTFCFQRPRPGGVWPLSPPTPPYMRGRGRCILRRCQLRTNRVTPARFTRLGDRRVFRPVARCRHDHRPEIHLHVSFNRRFGAIAMAPQDGLSVI